MAIATWGVNGQSRASVIIGLKFNFLHFSEFADPTVRQQVIPLVWSEVGVVKETTNKIADENEIVFKLAQGREYLPNYTITEFGTYEDYYDNPLFVFSFDYTGRPNGDLLLFIQKLVLDLQN